MEYRLVPQETWPAQLTDVKQAIGYLRQHAQELNVDPARIGAWGESAWGPSYGSQRAVQAVAELYGPTDFLSKDSLPHRL